MYIGKYYDNTQTEIHMWPATMIKEKVNESSYPPQTLKNDC